MTGSRKLLGWYAACAAFVSVAWSEGPERVELCDRVLWAFATFCGANAVVHKFKDEAGNGVAHGKTTNTSP